jgi:hypothetical protein
MIRIRCLSVPYDVRKERVALNGRALLGGAYRDDREPGLAGRGERCTFLVTDADPFDVAASDRVGERIKRVADQSEDVLDHDLFEHANQDACYGLRICASSRILMTNGIDIGNGVRHDVVPI